MNIKSGRSFLIAFLMVGAAVLVACSEGGSGSSAVEKVTSQVAFVYGEKIEEYNWSHLHEIGRKYIDEQLPDLGTKYVEDVSADDAEKVLRQLAEEGHKLIFATAAEYYDAVMTVASDFPDTKFEVYGGGDTADNVATYDGRMYQAFYVAGGYTGEMTVSGVIGFIAPEPTHRGHPPYQCHHRRFAPGQNLRRYLPCTCAGPDHGTTRRRSAPPP